MFLIFFYKQLEGVNSDLIKYYAHDDAAVGIIKEYTLCCIAGTDPDEENYEDELEDMVNQVIYREEQKSFFSRFGLRPEVQPVRCSGKKAEATHAELLSMNEENIHHQVVPMKTKHAENRFTVFHHPSDNLSHSIEANTLLINL